MLEPPRRLLPVYPAARVLTDACAERWPCKGGAPALTRASRSGSARQPRVGRVNHSLDVRGQVAGQDMSQRGLVEDAAQALPNRDPDLGQVLSGPVVGGLVRTQPPNL